MTSKIVSSCENNTANLTAVSIVSCCFKQNSNKHKIIITVANSCPPLTFPSNKSVQLLYEHVFPDSRPPLNDDDHGPAFLNA